MAVKPITNPFPRQGDQVNRAKQGEEFITK